eukprot:jgi/Mesen1/3650/ME000200S02732
MPDPHHGGATLGAGARASWRHQSAGGEGVRSGVRCQVSVCLHPFLSARQFTTESADKTFSDVRIIEWIDAHLLAGVDHIYFPDRNFRLRQRLLQPYVDRGQLLHLPFPDWSDVFYRLPFKKRLEPYFPEIYDQVLIYEFCGMLGRRYGDTWQFFTDLDEFVTVARPEEGSLKHQLTASVTSEEATRGHKLVLLQIHRFNFVGVTTETRMEPVLSHAARCKQPVYYNREWVGWMGKMASRPGLSVSCSFEVHSSKDVPSKYTFDVPHEVIRIHHYTSNLVDYMKRHPCELVKDNDKEVVPDTSATGWTAKVAWCKGIPCSSKDIPTYCLPFCSLSSRHESTIYILESPS